MTLESAYPYNARDNKCSKADGEFRITGYTDVPAKDCAKLEAAVEH